jgi:hypothetical protein
MTGGAGGRPATGPDSLPLPADECGEFPIRIARDGTWFHQGSPIGRKRLARLLSSVLRRDDEGRFWLVTPVERGIIQVDDAPFTAVELAAEGDGEDAMLRFRTNFDDWVTAGPDNPIRVAHDDKTGEPSPYIRVRDNLDALILRPVFYELVELAEPVERGGETVLGLWSAGAFFELGPA